MEAEEAAASIGVTPGALWSLEAGLGGVPPKKVRELLARYGADGSHAHGMTDAVGSVVNARLDGARSAGVRTLIHAE